MVTIVTCALLASAFVNPAFVSSSSQHLSNDHYAGWIFCQGQLFLKTTTLVCMGIRAGP